MKMTVCFLLLLLLCSPSTAQLQSQTDSEAEPLLLLENITALGEQTENQRREPTNASDQDQRCLQDLHAVVRELSASLAEQRVEMRHLQRENEAQEAKLESQRAEMERQKVEMEGQRVEVENLKQTLEAQAAELVSIKSRSNVTENQVEALRRDGEVKQVAFSASLLASGHVTLGPFNTDTHLVFRHVVSNTGNAYNPNTGVFTAPVKGAYHFEFNLGAHGHSSYPSAASLMKNGGRVFSAYDHRTGGYGTSANGVTLLLEVGDVVFLRQWTNTRIYDDGNHYSSFSGHLLFTM